MTNPFTTAAEAAADALTVAAEKRLAATDESIAAARKAGTEAEALEHLDAASTSTAGAEQVIEGAAAMSARDDLADLRRAWHRGLDPFAGPSVG